jgi:hypothetical protein
MKTDLILFIEYLNIYTYIYIYIYIYIVMYSLSGCVIRNSYEFELPFFMEVLVEWCYRFSRILFLWLYNVYWCFVSRYCPGFFPE